MQVNRSLEDRTFDKIDHALGRPLDPMAETYRNHYALMCLDCPDAKAFQASPYWRQGYSTLGTNYFHVTNAGRLALADYLRKIGDPHKAFEVTFAGDRWTVIDKSASKARYSAYLEVSDCCDLTFGEFCKGSSVRLHKVASMKEAA